MSPTNKNKENIVCDCPFCPLVNRKVRVCSVIVKFPSKYQVATFIPEEYKDLEEHFVMIALFFKNNKGINRKGKCISLENDEFTCYGKCIGKETIKIGFFTEIQENKNEK